MPKYSNTVLRVVFGTLLFAILVLLLFADNIEYYYKPEFMLSNPVIMGILLIIFAMVYLAYRFYKHNGSFFTFKKYDKLIIALTVVLFVGQVYVFSNIYFYTGWDVLHVRELAIAIVDGNKETMASQTEYFSTYPNNLFITFITAFIHKVNGAIGVFDKNYVVMIGVIINCILNSLTCYLVYKTAALYIEKKYALFSYFVAVFSLGISPWTIIFYSDAVGLFIPILTFYLYNKPIAQKNKRIAVRISSFCLGTVGYFIKPQCVIVLIAILIIEALKLFNGFKIKKLLKPAVLILTCAICFTTMSFSLDSICKKVDFELDKNKAFSMPHFFMMGLSETRSGGYELEDVVFSKSFDSSSERNSANIKESVKRIKKFGFSGYVKHLGKKLLTTFNDGTFSWGKEGRFYYKVPENVNSKVAPFLKSIYYSDGSKHEWFCLIQQAVWLAILSLSFIACFLKDNNHKNTEINILFLAIIGFILFEILFEVRARYVYIMVPIFCVLSAIGFKNLCESSKKIVKRVIK